MSVYKDGTLTATTEGSASGMASFDDREKGYEGKFAHDQELEFKARARRDKLVALWVAPQLGLAGPAADAYGKSLAMDGHEKQHEDKLVAKVMRDLSAKGVSVTDHQLRKKFAELYDQARAQIETDSKR
ncbi:MAG TPA: DUF1476 domain-containing protein [Dongiaceae bacterium]